MRNPGRRCLTYSAESATFSVALAVRAVAFPRSTTRALRDSERKRPRKSDRSLRPLWRAYNIASVGLRSSSDRGERVR
jgi:hypothetical protein